MIVLAVAATRTSSRSSSLSSSLRPALSSRIAPSTSWSYVRLSVEYLLSVGCLVAYSAVLARLSFGYLAALFSVCLLGMDMVIALLAHSRLSHRPGLAGWLVLLSRLCVCAFGQQWYLVGHTILFVSLSLYIWSLVLDNCAPARLTRLVPPFTSGAQQAEAASTLLMVKESVQPQEEREVPTVEAESDQASSTISASSGFIVPSLPVDWPIPVAVPQSFTRLHLLAVSLWLLWLLFAADVFAFYELAVNSSSLLSSSSSMAGWADETTSALLTTSPLCVALAGVLLTLELMALSLLWRLYHNAHFSLSAGCWLLLAVSYGPLLAAAVALQLSSQAAPLWLSLCIGFVPALCLHSVHLFCQWRLRDYRVAVESAFTRHVQSDTRLSAARRHHALLAVRRFDAKMVVGCCVQATLVFGFSACMVGLCPPWYVGTTVLLALLTLHFTLMPLFQWFLSLLWTPAMSLQCVGACVCLLGVCLLQFFCVQREELSSASFLLLVVLFLYPSALSVVLALYKWRDDGWLMAPFTVWCLLVGLLSLVLFCFLVAVLFPPWYVGAGLLLCVVSLLLLLLHVLPTLHSRRSYHNGPSSLSTSAVVFRVCVLLLGAVFPVVVGVCYRDVWLSFTAVCMVMLILCVCQLLGCALSLYPSVCPVSGLTPGWLSSVRSPRREYLLVDASSVLGVWLVSARSSASECNICPPRSLRVAAVSAYCLFAVVFVWSTLALFFPPASDHAPASSDASYSAASFDESEESSAAIAVSVSAALIAASCCATCWLTLHLAHLGRQQAVQFECERGVVQQMAAGAGQSQSAPISRQPPAATVAWQDGVDGSADAESGTALARSWLTAAKARARKSVPKVESFGIERSGIAVEQDSVTIQQRPSAAGLLLASVTPLRASSLNKVRPVSPSAASATVASSGGAAASAADELLAFVQSFQALVRSSVLSAFDSRAEYESACSLHDRYMRWSSERQLFGACQSVQLHHLLTLAQHDDINDAAAMCKHFETLRDDEDDRQGSERSRDRITAGYLALLSTHQQAVKRVSAASATQSMAPSELWSQYADWMTQWRSHRAVLVQAARQRRETWNEATVRRQQTLAEAAERQVTQSREAIAQRRAERRKAIQASQLDREQRQNEAEEEEEQEEQHQGRGQASRQSAAVSALTTPATPADHPQARKRRKNNRSTRKRHKQNSSQQRPYQQQQQDDDTPADKLQPDHGDASTDATTTAALPAQQPQTRKDDDTEAAADDCYRFVTSTVRRAEQPHSNPRKSNKVHRSTGKQVSQARTRHHTPTAPTKGRIERHDTRAADEHASTDCHPLTCRSPACASSPSTQQKGSQVRAQTASGDVSSAADQSAWQRVSDAAAASSQCTIRSTGTQPQYQHYFLCKTCADDEAPRGLGVCITCR